VQPGARSRAPATSASRTELATALQEPDSRSEATEALRGLVDAIVLTPDQGGETLQIELMGNLAAMLGATVQTKRSPESDDLSVQVSLVAGAGFEPATLGYETPLTSLPKTAGQRTSLISLAFLTVGGNCRPPETARVCPIFVTRKRVE
jgi:hypothetical protein